MRMMLKVSIPVEKGNEQARKGTLGKTMQSILAELKPEAAYFVADNGKRTGFIFFNMDDPSQIPGVVEPFFLAFNAAVQIQPAMAPEDLAKAGPSIKKAAEQYG